MRTRAGLALVSVVLLVASAAVHCGSDGGNPPVLAGGDASARLDAAQTIDSAPMPDSSSEGGGEAGSGVVSITPATVDFGMVNCGTAGTPQSVSITNNGTAPFNWTASLTSGMTFYTLSPGSGTVSPGTSGTVQVIPGVVPATSLVTPELYSGTLSITTTAPTDAPHSIPLHQTAHGAILKSTANTTQAFGGVAIGQMATQQFSVSNSGNLTTSLTLATGNPAFTVTSPLSVMPTQSVSPTITFSPTALQTYTGTLQVSVPLGTVLCGPLPADVSVTGTGTTAVSVQPTNLNYGIVQCGAAAAAFQTITITNTGLSMHWTPTLGRGANSAYSLADTNNVAIPLGVAQTLAASSSVTVRVVPKPVVKPVSTVADALADTLTISTDSSGDTPHNILLHETAQGAVLALAPNSIQISVPHGLSQFTGFQVQNTGNFTGSWTISVAKTSGDDGMFSINLTSGSLVGGTSQNGTLTSKAASTTNIQTLGYIRLTPAVGGVYCSDDPPDMPISTFSN